MRPLDIAMVRAALAGSELTHPSTEDPPAEGPAAAAVAAILREGAAGAEVLFIRRALREGDPWSGQMAFPGGRHAPDDTSLLATVVREVREEIGLDLAVRAELVGRLEDVEVMPRGERARGWVRPFVFAVREIGELRLDPREVDEVVWAPLGELHSGARATTTLWRGSGMELTFPAWDVQGRIVWGLTYKMLQSLLGRFDAGPEP